MKSADWSARQLADLETRPPQGTTWAVFAVLVVIAHTLLRIEARLEKATREDVSSG